MNYERIFNFGTIVCVHVNCSMFIPFILSVPINHLPYLDLWFTFIMLEERPYTLACAFVFLVHKSEHIHVKCRNNLERVQTMLKSLYL